MVGRNQSGQTAIRRGGTPAVREARARGFFGKDVPAGQPVHFPPSTNRGRPTLPELLPDRGLGSRRDFGEPAGASRWLVGQIFECNISTARRPGPGGDGSQQSIKTTFGEVIWCVHIRLNSMSPPSPSSITTSSAPSTIHEQVLLAFAT